MVIALSQTGIPCIVLMFVLQVFNRKIDLYNKNRLIDRYMISQRFGKIDMWEIVVQFCNRNMIRYRYLTLYIGRLIVILFVIIRYNFILGILSDSIYGKLD